MRTSPALRRAIAVPSTAGRMTGDPAVIEIADRKKIAIVIGTPPAVIPKPADFSRP